MDLELTGSSALITGGSSGIGLACVATLLAEGANVVTCGRNAGTLERSLAAYADAYPGKLVWQTADVRNADQMEAVVNRAIDEFGALDAVVNNAGASRMSTFESTTSDDWLDELTLKIFSVTNTIHAARPHLAQSANAAIVNVNAVLARQPERQLVATSAARAALLNLSKSLATELSVENIRVNSVCVGLIDTGQWTRRYDAVATAETFPDWSQAIADDRGVVLRRFGRADEVAAAIVFLLSRRASYITGTAVEVAGGVSRYV
ncbi:SDR family oxidoreductase [Homoserinimonas sp. A447]